MITVPQANGSNDMTLQEAAAKYAKMLQDRAYGDRPGWQQTIDYLKSHGLDHTIAEKYQLGLVNPARQVDRPYTGWLMIPYITRNGILTARYRCTQDHGGLKCKDIDHHTKYVQPKGVDPRLFNPEAFFMADDTIGIAEGEIDAIVATEIVGIPTVGIPGVDTWKANRKVWRRCFDDFENIIIFADNDPADERFPNGAGVRLAEWIQEDVGGDRSLLVTCDQGEDVSSMAANGKAMILRERAGLERMERVRGDS